MKVKIGYILSTLMLCFNLTAKAQVTVEQMVDSIGILIGEQAHLSLKVTFPQGSRLQWPNLKERQYVTPGVEIVDIAKPDTIGKEGNSLQVERVYTITSFDERLYAIPALTVKVNGKPYQGANSALKVITVSVDTLHPNQFYPPKDVQDNPFKWSEWAPFFWLSILIVVLGLAGGYLYIRLRENKPIITKIRIVRHVPPHQRALNAIEKIKADHMQTSENQKEYYTKLTNTLRMYIQERFNFNAMEMTSDQIIEHLQQVGDQKMIDELRELFQTADLVKFAKYSTLLNENDLNLVNAVNFIDQTKQEGQNVEERIVPQLSDDEMRERHSRLTIKTLLYGIGILMGALLIYVIYNIYMLLG